MFKTLDAIITDLLLVIRNSNISRTEEISPRQVENWVHQYRSKLLKQDIDKGKYPNPDYIQELGCIELESIEQLENSTVKTGEYIMRTTQVLPTTINLNHKSGILAVTTADGSDIQLIPQTRSNKQKYKKYTSQDLLAYLKNNYLYIVSKNNPVKYVNVRGIFEIPTDAAEFYNSCLEQNCYDINNDAYPLPTDMFPTLKEMIIKGELGVMVQAPSDESNDSKPEYKSKNVK
jgi:hypothetical protein